MGLDPNNVHADQVTRDRSVDCMSLGGLTIGEIITRYEALRRQYYSGGYMGAKRRELVRRIGYDAKNAAHLIRLLRLRISIA